jgi:peptide/nickel transport system permease protein
MLKYLLRRFAYAVLTFLGITLAVFVLIHSVPGDPITFFTPIGHTVPPAVLAAIRHEHYLDQPLTMQYLHWLRGVVTLDFGRSITDGRPVVERVAERLPSSFELNLIAFLLALGIGVPFGVLSASRSGGRTDRGSSVIFFILYSLPSFWVALLLVQLFALRWGVLPVYGITSDDYADLSSGAQLLDRLRHLALPVVTLAYAQLAIFSRFTKAALMEVIREQFITAARARGAGEARVLWLHALRNALIPLITLLSLTIPSLISGSVIVEQIFQWNGIGHLYIESILTRDYPTVLALTVTTAVVTLAASLVADVLYAVADPRIRLQERDE